MEAGVDKAVCGRQDQVCRFICKSRGRSGRGGGQRAASYCYGTLKDPGLSYLPFRNPEKQKKALFAYTLLLQIQNVGSPECQTLMRGIQGKRYLKSQGKGFSKSEIPKQ